MASLYTNELLPTTSEQAIREFNEKYLAVISVAPPPIWADRFVTSIGAPRATFPISLLTTKFNETKEQSSRFRKMAEESFDVKVVEYDAGHEAPMIDIFTNVFAYRNWNRVPERFRIAEGRHVTTQLATLLETGTTATSPWDSVAFFSASHKANPAVAGSSTWGNYQSSALDPASVTNLTAEITSMMGVLDENGDKLGAMPDEIWLPTGKFQSVSNLLNQNLINNGESNPMLGKLKPVHVPELADTNDWYLVDSKLIAMGIDPLFAAKYQPPDTLGLRFWDESSDFFKDTGKIKVSQHIWYGFALALPHAIRLVRGA
jgi:Mu-like prophage major head subunit gpT